MFEYLDGLRTASPEELEELVSLGPAHLDRLAAAADTVRRGHYGNRVFFRGLVEFSNHCKNGCLYCGLTRDNASLRRYRLSPEEILACCLDGYRRGFRSFVLQSGEDPFYNGGKIVGVVAALKDRLPDCAMTVSVGELPERLYGELRAAGADRYLLRHETANPEHYAYLHPADMSRDARRRCLYAIREAGLAAGCGFMVGSPGQTPRHLVEDLVFLREFEPEMVGIGPFIPQAQTAFADRRAGSLEQTLVMVALARLVLPKAMIPATTALGSLRPDGREMGLRAGANVVMPNLTPPQRRRDYALYDGKAGVDDGVGEGLERIVRCVENAGFVPDFSRGDHVDYGRRPAV